MCLIVFAWNESQGLIVAANRDEFFERPAEVAEFWKEAPELLAGRDLRGGGTWLGVTRRGRFAALTNYRDPAQNDKSKRTRGALVRDFLLDDCDARAYLARLTKSASQYNGYSIIFGDERELFYYCNQGDVTRRIQPGIHGLSNRLLDDPWPKTTKAKEGLGALLARAPDDESRMNVPDDASRPSVPVDESRMSVSSEDLFALMSDSEQAPDELLPETGVGLEKERFLSPIFISGEIYGTRSTTVVRISAAGHVSFAEKTFDPGRHVSAEVREEFDIDR